MATPSYVATGSVAIHPTVIRWPSSLTVSSGAAPSGVANGDRCVMFIGSSYSQDRSPLDDRLDYWDIPGWTYIHHGEFSATFSGAVRHHRIDAFTCRWSVNALPTTVTPVGVSTGAGYVPALGAINTYYRAQIAAWRPSASPSDTGSETSANTATLLPDSGFTLTAVDSEALAVVAGHLDSGSIGSFDTSNGFTERFHQAAITPQGGGSMKVADKSLAATSTASPVWTKPTGPNGAVVGFVLDEGDPAVGRPLGWNVGMP